eukprot:scaffold85834_cov44-Cyclotella_meneghiniana.AAC.1
MIDLHEDNNLSDDIGDILDVPETWTWQDMLHTQRGFDGGLPFAPVCAPESLLDLLTQLLGMPPCGLPAPTFISPSGYGLNWRMRRHIIRRVAEKLDSQLHRSINEQTVMSNYSARNTPAG